jgi:hypothetical protein
MAQEQGRELCQKQFSLQKHFEEQEYLSDGIVRAKFMAVRGLRQILLIVKKEAKLLRFHLPNCSS